MSKRQFAIRQKMWLRFHAWEEQFRQSSFLPDPVKTIGELADLYRSANPAPEVWTTESVAGIRAMRSRLRSVRG